MNGRTVFAVFACLTLVSICACRSGPATPPETAWSEQIAAADARFQDGDYESARATYQQVLTIAPFIREAPQVQIRTADCSLKLKDYEAARTAYGRYLKLYPGGGEAAYATLMTAETYFAEIGTVDRDPEPARKALSWYRNVLSSYPSSPQAASAKARIADVANHLGAYQLMVANFYRQAGNLHAAAARLQVMLERYPECDSVPEARRMLAEIGSPSDPEPRKAKPFAH